MRAFLVAMGAALVFVLVLNYTLLYAIWGGNGPEWFNGVCFLDGMVGGILFPMWIVGRRV